MYKKNPISSGLVTLIDPSNNNSYGTGSVIRDSAQKSNMIVAAPTAYNQLFNVDYAAAPSITDPFGGNNAYLLREWIGGGVGSASIVLSSLSAYTPGTYTNIPTTSSTGVGCTVNFTINSTGNIVSPVTINVTGQKYSVNDTVTIPAGGSFGGTAPANNILLNVTTLVAQTKFALQSLTAEYDGNVWGQPDFSQKACITHSVYVKAVDASRRLYLVHDNVDGNGLTYNFTTNTITNNDSSRIISTGSQILSDGWVRIWYTHKLRTPAPASSSTVPGNPRLRIYIQNSAGALSYIGNGTSGFYVYGHQYEYGALSNYTAKLTSTREKWFSARVTSAGNGPPGQFGELYGGAPVIKFNDPDSTGQRQGMVQYGGENNITAMSNFSAFAWVKLDDTAAPINSFGFPSDWCNIIGRINGKQNNNDFQIRKDGRQLAFNARFTRLPGATYYNEVIFSDILPTSIADRWVYVGITFVFENVPSGGDVFVKFYINGVQSGSMKMPNTAYSYTGLDNTVAAGCFIGYDSSTTFNWGQFKGYMGMIGIYNRELSANEMLYNFNCTKYRYYDDCQDITSSNLILRLDSGNTTSYPGTGVTWTDISGSANNSTLVGSPTYSTLDQGSLTFNGTSQYVAVPNSTLFLSNTNMSVSIWFNASSLPPATNYTYSLMNQGRQEDRNYFWLALYGNTTSQRISWEVGTSLSNFLVLTHNWTPAANTWYNVVGTFEPGLAKIYVNGVLVASGVTTAMTVGPTNTLYPFNVGAYRNTNYFFPGKLNLPLYYDKTLSASEVLCNYNAIKHRYI